MPTYNKLIRNKIPQIIKSKGKTPTTRILPKDEYIKELCKKTQEELSDLLELINALAEHEGKTLEEINSIRKKKAEERGGFSDRVFLIEVTDK
ncbi:MULTISPECIES: nucleoside triphosphate pyrophosphohydrolase [Bacillus cereus group]|uniref:nucleoside triphosphate pyrophosphohydrolase n=1 Tax=Bacillus cereus group TaxID=86661 RepID=UPI000995C9AA|nr:nucleoside triphosphate pyrophosphohydrolase [Bacillus cereus]OOZ90809.1 phosphoribosyl-ATP pyrophosphohydrolase [Bacillus cereus]HDR7827537.1 nucleoside triphosphate pyrophosphohydrolase [Bacillus anthracis]